MPIATASVKTLPSVREERRKGGTRRHLSKADDNSDSTEQSDGRSDCSDPPDTAGLSPKACSLLASEVEKCDYDRNSLARPVFNRMTSEAFFIGTPAATPWGSRSATMRTRQSEGMASVADSVDDQERFDSLEVPQAQRYRIDSAMPQVETLPMELSNQTPTWKLFSSPRGELTQTQPPCATLRSGIEPVLSSRSGKTQLVATAPGTTFFDRFYEHFLSGCCSQPRGRLEPVGEAVASAQDVHHTRE